MRLTWKLTISLSGAMCLLLGGYAFTSARAHMALFQEHKEYDGRLVGHSVAAAVAAEHELRGLEAAKRLVVDADARDPDVHIRWVDFSPSALPASRPMAAVTLSSFEGAGQISHVGPGPGGVDAVFTYTMLPDVGQRSYAVEIAQTLGDREAFVRATILRAGISLLLLLLATAIIATVAGNHFVGKPVEMLLQKAKSITDGDFMTELRISQRDEFGDLGAALVEAGAELQRKQEQVQREHQEKLEAEIQLRRAHRLATVGKLASGVAHEVGTPLNVVHGHAGLIANNEAAPEQCRESAAVIQRQTERITKIIRELLVFARQGREGPNARQTVDLVALSRNTLSLVETLPLAAGADLSVSAADGAPLETVGDSSQLQQVVMNLFVNGLQAIGTKGRLSVDVASTPARAPDAPGEEKGDYVCVSVSDDGAGIAEEDLPHVFEPFYTTKDVGQGTGLGLSVAYGIVRDHGGWIDVHSRLGEGSRFDVFLPRRSPSTPSDG